MASIVSKLRLSFLISVKWNLDNIRGISETYDDLQKNLQFLSELRGRVGN